MKKALVAFGLVLFLFPAVSSAATFTQPQINAIIGLLQAFDVAQATIDNVLVELTPTTLSVTPTYQSAPVPLFGNIISSQTQVAPSQVTPAIVLTQAPVSAMQSPASSWSILLTIQGDYDASTTGTANKITANPTVTQSGMVHIMVSAYDPNGTYQKVPITVTTNDPDLPASWTFNAQPHPNNFFCVAPTYPTFPDNGCVNANPVSTGTFTFTYTAEGATTTQQVTVVPQD